MSDNHSHAHHHEQAYDDAIKLCDSVSEKKPIASYHLSELVIDEVIMGKANDLAAMIAQSADAKLFRAAEVKIQANERVQALIKTIKRKQKEAVAFEQFGNPQKVTQIEAEIAELQAELDDIPVVQQFKQTQDDLNHLLQLVIGVVADQVSKQIKVELANESTESPANCSDET